MALARALLPRVSLLDALLDDGLRDGERWLHHVILHIHVLARGRLLLLLMRALDESVLHWLLASWRLRRHTLVLLGLLIVLFDLF